MNKVFCVAVGIVLVLAGAGRAANWTNSAKSGDWNVAVNWNPQDVPDTLAESAELTNTLTAGPYTCRVDTAMYSAVTVGVLRLRNHQANLNNGYTKVLANSGVKLTVGDPGTPGFINCYGSIMSGTNAGLTVYGNAAVNAFELNSRPVGWPWSADFANSDLLISGGGTGLWVHVNGSISSVRYAANMRMTDGSLTVTNATSSSLLYIGGAAEGTTNALDQVSSLSLARTKLTADAMALAGGIFTFDGAGASGPSVISNTMAFGYLANDSKGGTAEFRSGDLTVGAVTANNSANSGNIAAYLKFIVTGATVNVRGNMTWQSGGSTVHTLRNPAYIDVYSGSLAVGNSLSNGMGQYYSESKYYVRLFGGSLTVSNNLTLAGASSSANAPAILEVYGGRLTAGNLAFGRAGTYPTDTYFNQSGGTSTVNGVIYLYATNTSGIGLQQFLLGTNGTLVLKGNGFEKVATTDWSTNLLTDANLSFKGKTVFDPGAGVTVQTNFAFGRDVGPVLAGLTNFAAAGTWDFSAVGTGEKVKVVGAGNYTGADSNAVYVRSILGLPSAEATNRLQSAVNIYYDPRRSVQLGVQDLPLTGGGRLKAVSVKVAATLIWVM